MFFTNVLITEIDQQTQTNLADLSVGNKCDESPPYEMPSTSCRPEEPKYERINTFDNPGESSTTDDPYENAWKN